MRRFSIAVLLVALAIPILSPSSASAAPGDSSEVSETAVSPSVVADVAALSGTSVAQTAAASIIASAVFANSVDSAASPGVVQTGATERSRGNLLLGLGVMCVALIMTLAFYAVGEAATGPGTTLGDRSTQHTSRRPAGLASASG